MRTAAWVALLALACTGREPFDDSKIQHADDVGDPDDLPTDVPVSAVDDAAATWTEKAVVIRVTSNDDGRRLHVVDVGDPDAGGTARAVSNKEVEYVSAPGFVGTEAFGYTIEGRGGGRADGTVTVTVGPKPTVEITAPAEGATLDGVDIEITFVVDGCSVSSPSANPDGCHLHKWIDGGRYENPGGGGHGHYDSGPFTISGLTEGERTFELHLVTNDGSDDEYVPVIGDEVTFTYEIATSTGDTGL